MNTETDFPPTGDVRVRATAWALGQLTAAETEAFETEMALDADLAAYAQEMQQFCTLISLELPPCPESRVLPGASRDRVIAALSATDSSQPRSFLRRHWLTGALLASAACLVLSLSPHWLETVYEPKPILSSPPNKSRNRLTTVADNSFSSASSGLQAGAGQNINWSSQPGAISSFPDKDSINQGIGTPVGLSTQQSEIAFSPDGTVTKTARRKEIDKLLRDVSSSIAPADPYAKDDPVWNETLRSLKATKAEMEARKDSDSYKALPQNPFLTVAQAPLSTFSIDVDTASYANVRRFLNLGRRPPAEAVRLEELVNYFPYEETPPRDGKPFAVKVDLTTAPWNPAYRLARIALKGKEVTAAQRPASNLVFLVDVSGSMADSNKLPLVQQSLRLLTERLTENDRVSVVTYAGSSSVVLPSTNGQEKVRIMTAIDSLSSGGSTNGSGGIASAYQQAVQHFIKDGVNRVILATDGDFNVGLSSHEALLALIQEKAQSGVFLSVLGYGMGNLKDDTMELLADKGNGNYAYIDSLSEARKTLVEQMSGTLVTIAKDVKIQIEFNPAAVKSWRLLGYENRLLAKEDFNNDKKDAGEIGAGHNVTALYEIVPAGAPDATPQPVVDGLKYQQVPAVNLPRVEPTPAALTGELMNVKLRWKQPAGETSELLEVPVRDTAVPLDQAGQETRWATAVAAFAQRLRGETTATLTWEQIRQLARGAKGADPFGYRGEFLQLIDKAESVCP